MSLKRRLLYKRVIVGEVEKDGKKYTKYKQTRRFSYTISESVKQLGIVLLALLLTLSFLYIYSNYLSAKKNTSATKNPRY